MPHEPENPYEPPAANIAATSAAKIAPAPVAVVICQASIVLMGCATLFLVFCAGPVVWILKDGMGPDATDSSGLESLERMFWTFYWGPATVAAMGMLLGTLYWRFRLSRPAKSR